MLTGLAALEGTDWSRLLHAYGRATDTPGHLRALLEEDTQARNAALSHLWSAILHQGTPWTATGPVALVLTGLLDDPRLDSGERPLRADLLSFLTGVIEAFEQSGSSVEELERLARYDLEPLLDADDDDAIYEDEDAANALYAQALLGCARVAPVLTGSVLSSLDDADTRVRMRAAVAAVALSSTFPEGRKKELETRLSAMARAAANSDERSTLVLALGDLGAAPASFLTDPSPAVRVCAALAPALATNETATRELLQALEQHADEVDGWFTDKPPQFPMRPRFALLARLMERVTDFERLATAAVSLARITTSHCVDMEWGPLLAAAFPDGRGEVKTDAQRRFLAALVENTKLWDPRFGNPLKWFKKAGLPYEREPCTAKLRG